MWYWALSCAVLALALSGALVPLLADEQSVTVTLSMLSVETGISEGPELGVSLTQHIHLHLRQYLFWVMSVIRVLALDTLECVLKLAGNDALRHNLQQASQEVNTAIALLMNMLPESGEPVDSQCPR